MHTECRKYLLTISIGSNRLRRVFAIGQIFHGLTINDPICKTYAHETVLICGLFAKYDRHVAAEQHVDYIATTY